MRAILTGLRNRWFYAMLLCVICFACLLCAGCGSDVWAKNKSAGSEESEQIEQAYQEFLNGERRVYIEKQIQELIQMEFPGAETSGVFLQDVMKKVCDDYGHEVFQYKMETVQYAYLDCFDDGKKELAISFCGLIPADDGNWTAVIVYEDGRLYLRHAFYEWARSVEKLYYYGYIEYDGSGGAATHYTGETVLDRIGRACVIYDAVSNYQTFCGDVPDMDEIFVCEKTYTIGEKTYRCLSLAEDESDLASWEEYYSLCEQMYGKLDTQEEVEALLAKRREKFGIQEEWLEKRELEWNLLENSIYREYVKEIELLETRKERSKNNSSTLKDKWVPCDPWQFSGQDNYEQMEGFHINMTWRAAIEAVLEDYGRRADLPKGKWTVEDFVAYRDGDGNEICAVTVQSEESERELCLLLDSDAVAMQMEDYTEYIVAVDFRSDDSGEVKWGMMSYDSMLDWTSFAHQARVDVDEIYTVCESENQLYSFEWQSDYAMNQYLKDKGADTSRSWELDVNAVCAIGGGRLEIVRYFCGDEEIVMVIDKQNQKFAVVKGLDGE